MEDNDEDLFTYFEEYVEMAGEQYDRFPFEPKPRKPLTEPDTRTPNS